MPLGVREVLLVVRAQESATGVLSNLAGSFRKLNQAQQAAANAQIKQGKALVAVGVGIAAVGAAGLKFMATNTEAAIAYNKQVAYTKTQMQGVKGSMQQVSQVGLQVGRSIPVALDSIQGGLYDIFSSMDVNLKQAKTLLVEFSKQSVAGQVSLQDAGRATIGIMNAYHMKVTQVNKVSDVMFQLVRKGVGTFSDFANAIGRATPSAARAGESIQQLAGMMAFLTRNGLSAASASASSGRALDALTKIAGSVNLKTFGKLIVSTLGLAGDKAKRFADESVNIVNKAGNLKSVVTIVKELSGAMQGLSKLQKTEVLTELFKGAGGTIQAMRFLSPAVDPGGAKQLAGLTKSMRDAKGATQSAYDTMKKTPAEQIQQLKNDWQELRIQLGQALLPAITKLIGFFGQLVGWFDKLSPRTLKILGWVITITALLVTLTGIVIAVAGAISILTAVLAGVELLGAPILVTVGLIVAAVIALAAAAFFIIKYWGPISKWFHDMWFDMWHWVNSIWQSIVNYLQGVWGTISQDFHKGLTDVQNIWNTVWHDIKTVASDIWNGIVVGFKVFLNILLFPFMAWWLLMRKPIEAFWNWIKPFLQTGWDWIKKAWNAATTVVKNVWDTFWGDVKSIARVAWAVIKSVVSTGWDNIRAAFNSAVSFVKRIWNDFWGAIKTAAKDTWSYLVNGFKNNFWDPIKSGFQKGIKIVEGIWNSIKKPLIVPVDFLIGTVWNHGIARVWNAAAKITGAPKIPQASLIPYAKGGIVNKPTLGVFGEAGPEMILPLSKPRRMMELLSQVMPMHSGGGIFGSIGNVVGKIGNWLGGSVSGLAGKAFGPVEALLGQMPGTGVAGTMLKDTGKGIIEGLGKSLVSEAKKLFTGSSGKFKGSFGPGVAQWRPDVLRALAMLGEPASLAGNVLFQMQTESGGNPNAINLWDSNAAMGDPSRGLMQTIMSTFLAYAGPFRSRSIYDPLANIYAAINYAIHRYGRSLMSGGMGIGSGHGYAGGTGGARRGWAWVGERGRELVNFGGGEQVMSHRQSMMQAALALHGYVSGTTGGGSGPGGGGKHKKLTSEQSTALTLINRLVSSSLNTVAEIKTMQRDMIKEIQKYYSGSHAKWRDQMIDRQTKAFEKTATKLSAVNSKIAAAMSYYNQLKSSLASYSALSGIDITGTSSTSTSSSNFAGGVLTTTGGTSTTGGGAGAIVSGLQAKLANIKKFSAALKTLKKMGLNKNMLNQIIQMGPDDGLTYAQALISGGSSVIGQVNSLQKQLTDTSTSLAKSATNLMYDSGKQAGKGFLSGLKAQKAQLDKEMKHYGDLIGKELAKWFHVPKGRLPHFASGGYLPAGQWGVVGENGPEPIMVGANGALIRPNHGHTGASKQVVVNVYTNEINPRYHAAQLGWELARRSA